MTFSFIQITDHHLRESEATLTRGYSTWHAFRAVMRHIAQHHPDVDFIVTTGDLVDMGTDAEYQHVRAMLGIAETSDAPGPQRVSIVETLHATSLHDMPMYFLPGNHDPREAFFRNMFPTAVGADSRPPLHMDVSFAHKGIRFVCLDWGNENKAVASPAMLDFVARSLQSDAPTIIVTHHHVAPMGIPRLDAFLADNVARFADIIRGRNVLSIFCGHTHATYETQLAGIPVHGLRSTTFSFAADGDGLLYVLRPPHYRVVTVAEGAVSTEIVEVPL